MKTVAAILIGFLLGGGLHAARLKDLVAIEGVRENQLMGYGIVVGLAGTGDRQQTVFSNQSLTNILERMGISVSPTAIRVKNTAAVMVTATLPAFAQPGMRIDTTVSSVGDASNLQGGILLLTSLRGADGQVYAVAQGPVVTGGFAAGRGGTSQTVNHPTVGRGPNGATVERGPVHCAKIDGAPPVAPIRFHYFGAHYGGYQQEVFQRREPGGAGGKCRFGERAHSCRVCLPHH